MNGLDWAAIMLEFEKRLASALRRALSEEDIRQELRDSMIQRGIAEASIERAVPHPWLRGKPVDFRLRPSATPVWLEVKYHRHIPSGWNQPSTQKYGELVADLYRLKLAMPAGSGFLLYVTDPEMQGYLTRNVWTLIQASAQDPFQFDEAFLEALPKTAWTEVIKRVLPEPSAAGVSAIVERLRKTEGEAVVEWKGGVADHLIFLFGVVECKRTFRPDDGAAPCDCQHLITGSRALTS